MLVICDLVIINCYFNVFFLDLLLLQLLFGVFENNVDLFLWIVLLKILVPTAVMIFIALDDEICSPQIHRLKFAIPTIRAHSVLSSQSFIKIFFFQLSIGHFGEMIVESTKIWP